MIDYDGNSQTEYVGRGVLRNGGCKREIDVYSNGSRFWTISGLASTGPELLWITPFSSVDRTGMTYRRVRNR